MAIRAVTFDFWRTLFKDTRSRERHQARVDALIAIAGVDPDMAQRAMKHVMGEFLRTHVAEQRTLSPADTVPILEAFLGHHLEPGIHGELEHAFSSAILEHPPEPIDDAIDAVARTAERVPVGVISDSGISPGSMLERLLHNAGIADRFTVLTFSDRVGVAKPQRAMYESSAAALGCEPGELFHIGDLEPTDVVGALGVGATAALFAGDNDRYAADTSAQYTFWSWREYIEQLDALL